MTLHIGDLNIQAVKLGSGGIAKIYIGDTLVYGVPDPEKLWDVLDGGTTIQRASLPVTIPAYVRSGYTYNPITASDSLTISNIGLGNTATISADGTTLSRGMNCSCRDCTVGLVSCLPDGYSNQDVLMGFTDDIADNCTEFLKLDKDGTVIEGVTEMEEYYATAPNNFLVYDSSNDTITLKAGTYDSSKTVNAPTTINSDVTLNSMGGGMYADDNWTYTYNVDIPSVSISLFSKYYQGGSPLASKIEYKKSRTLDSSLKLCVNYDYSNGKFLTTSYNTFTYSSNFTSGCILNNASGCYVSSGQSIDLLFTLDTAKLSQVLRDDYSYNLSTTVPRATGVVNKVYLVDSSDNETLIATFNGNGSYQFQLIPVTKQQLVNAAKIRYNFEFTADSTMSKYGFIIEPSIRGKLARSYSKNVNLETMQGMFQIGYGYKSHLYENEHYDSLTDTFNLASFTETPLYEVL